MKSLWEAPPHIVHQQIPRYGHKDVNGLTFAAGALCFESAHISNQPFNYLHAGRCNLMVLPRSKNVIAFALNKSNSSLLTEIEITELLSQSWRPPGVEQKIHCWQTLSGKRFWFTAEPNILQRISMLWKLSISNCSEMYKKQYQNVQGDTYM